MAVGTPSTPTNTYRPTTLACGWGLRQALPSTAHRCQSLWAFSETLHQLPCVRVARLTVRSAFSLSRISVTSTQITKSVSGDGDGSERTSDTMGMKHRVDRGIYVFYGSMNPRLSVKTGFSDSDAAEIKAVLPGLFENDASSARPEGSVEVLKVIWWEHNCASGQCSSAKVHRSAIVRDTDDLAEPIAFEPATGDARSSRPTPEVIDGA